MHAPFSHSHSPSSKMSENFERVTFARADGKDVPVLLYGAKGAPAVVVIQEWWGVEFEVKQHAARIASLGYRALVPDLYRGKLGAEAEEAHHLMSNLDFQDACVDIIECARFLRKEGSPCVGVTGFCMGGALAIGAAAKAGGEIACTAPFYGYNAKLADVATTLRVPLQGHFGALDKSKGFADVAAAKALEEACKAAGVEHDVFIYDTVGQCVGRRGRACTHHCAGCELNSRCCTASLTFCVSPPLLSPLPRSGFLNATPEGIERKKKLGQGEHDQAAVDLAWARLEAFFAKHLTPAPATA